MALRGLCWTLFSICFPPASVRVFATYYIAGKGRKILAKRQRSRTPDTVQQKSPPNLSRSHVGKKEGETERAIRSLPPLSLPPFIFTYHCCPEMREWGLGARHVFSHSDPDLCPEPFTRESRHDPAPPEFSLSNVAKSCIMQGRLRIGLSMKERKKILLARCLSRGAGDVLWPFEGSLRTIPIERTSRSSRAPQQRHADGTPKRQLDMEAATRNVQSFGGGSSSAFDCLRGISN